MAVDQATQTASAQSATFTVSPAQPKINQNISSAAVKRSNRALNYLAPIRTTQTDNADDGSNGVKPLSAILGSGDGWGVGQLDQGQKQYWVNVSAAGAITATSGPTGTGAFTATRTAAGTYTINFQTTVSACSWSANAVFPAPPGAPLLALPIAVPGQPTQVQVRTVTPAGAPTDTNFTVQVLC